MIKNILCNFSRQSSSVFPYMFKKKKTHEFLRNSVLPDDGYSARPPFVSQIDYDRRIIIAKIRD